MEGELRTTIKSADKRRQARKNPEWRVEDFRTIVNRNADAMIVLDRAGYVFYVNPAAESLFNLPAGEMVDANFGFPIMLEEPVELYILREFKDFVAAEMRMAEVMWAGEPSYLLSFRDLTDRIMAEKALSRTRDELDTKVNERTSELSDTNKRLEREIAERKLSEEKLSENHRFTSVLLGNLPGMVFRCRNDEDWTMEFLSPGCEVLTGYKVQDLSYNRKISYARLIHPDDRERVWNDVQAAFNNKTPFKTTYRIITAEGEEKWVWTQGRRLFYKGRDTVEGYVFDITDTKRAEEALNEAKEQAELYVDLMGHDINNLNHSAMGYLELALGTLDTEKKLRLDDRVLIQRPMQSLANSSALIDNVRKLQRLKTEGVKTRPTDLNKIFRELESMNFDSNDRDVLINIQHIPGCLVEANELLKDVFVNLVANAVKHSDAEKPLTINVKVEPINKNDKKYYKIMVEDDGPGIPDELKGKLFHRFQRGATEARGKGLGLYIVRTLVEGYRGEAWVEDSVPDDRTKGAKFVVMLPAVDS